MTIEPNGWPNGLLTALVTPLKDDAVDTAALVGLVESQIAAGVRGVVVCGGTGEFGALSVPERRQVAEEVVRAVAGRASVIVQAGALATRDALNLSSHAAEIGAAALLVASPFGEPINWRERRSFYEQVAAAAELPIMVYNTPPAGILTLEQVEELFTLPNVSAIKDSSGDPYLLGDLLAWAGETGRAAVYVGADTLIADGLAGGASGAVLGAGNFLAPELVRLVVSLGGGDGARHEPQWREMRRLLRFMELSPNYVALVKAGCTARGVDVGSVRSPYLMPSAEESKTLADLLSAVEDAFAPASP